MAKTPIPAYPVTLDLDTAHVIMYEVLHRVMGWFDETMAPSPACNNDLEDLASRAEALAQMCTAMARPQLAREVDAHEEAKRQQAAFEKEASVPFVSPATATRLAALRAEFTEDPDGIDLLIRLAGNLARHSTTLTPEQVDPPATPITAEQSTPIAQPTTKEAPHAAS